MMQMKMIAFCLLSLVWLLLLGMSLLMMRKINRMRMDESKWLDYPSLLVAMERLVDEMVCLCVNHYDSDIL